MIETSKNTSADSSSPRKKTSFAGDVLTLVSGTTFAQILTILIAPILTRLYGPKDFGLLALFLSITGIIGIIVCLRYELSIMLPKSDEEAANLLVLSLFIALTLSIFTIPFICFGRQPIQNVLKAPQLGTYLWLVPLFVFVSGVFLALNYWNSRTKHFKRLSAATITSSVASTGAQLGAGFAGYATGGSLIVANLVGQSVSTLILGGQIWKDDHSLIQKSISKKTMIAVIKRYRKFPLISTWSALLNTASWQLPNLILASFFSPSVVGFYSMGFRLLQLPMSFIGGSISQVFFQRAVEAKSEGTLPSLVENIFRLLVVIGMFPILTLTIVGGDFFTVIFGNNWTESGVYVQILSIWAFIWFISSPLSILIDVMERQKFELKYTFFNFSTRLLSLVIGGLLGNARFALVLFSISGIFVYGYLCFKMLLFSNVNLSHIISIILSNFILFVPAGIILIVLKFSGINQYILVGVSLLLGVIYYLYILKTDPQMNMIRSRLNLIKA